MSKTSIVIPIYNKWALTHQILFDIFKHCSGDYEVIIVNDHSPETDVRAGMDWWHQCKMLNLKEIILPENLMFLKASNVGLREADGEYVITVSNDVRIQMDLTSHVKALLHKNPKQLIGGRLLNWDTGWNTFKGVIYPYLEGWLLATTRAGWEELDYFDERFAPSDMEDVDISTKARRLGYELSPLHHLDIHHVGAQSIGYNPEREAITIQNKKKFEEKWTSLDKVW
jgi:GT2 family glycosyltransferase